MPTRIYAVTSNDKEWLVRATSKNQAIRHVASRLLNCEVASQDELLRLAQTVKVENATNPEQPELPLDDKQEAAA